MKRTRVGGCRRTLWRFCCLSLVVLAWILMGQISARAQSVPLEEVKINRPRRAEAPEMTETETVKESNLNTVPATGKKHEGSGEAVRHTRNAGGAAASTKKDSLPRLTLRGLGPIKIGMTLAEARAATSGPLKSEYIDGDACFYVTPTDMPKGISYMVTEGRISRIDIFSSAYASLSGARIGQTQEQLMAMYKGKLKKTRHTYIEEGFYLTFVPQDAEDQQYRMVFDTDGKHVLGIRAGKLPEVEFVEGCL